MPSFTDSVDAEGRNEKGICGEKVLVLSDEAPSFLSVEADSNDPINGGLTLIYDETKATLDDVGKTFIVFYTVSFADYPKNTANSLTSSFEFKIRDPDSSGDDPDEDPPLSMF